MNGIQEGYVVSAPSPQQTVDVFKGLWSSRIPIEGVTTGASELFNDGRINWFLQHIGSVEGKRILELGPLEGGHTYMLTRAGAAVTAIEANTNAYLRCLAVKELLKIEGADFLLGDFTAFLEADKGARYDAILASGVLYHLSDPLKTLQKLMARTDNLCIWSMFYDEHIETLPADSVGRTSFTGEVRQRTLGDDTIAYHMRTYYGTAHGPGFSGGVEEGSVWLRREALEALLRRHGYTVTVEFASSGDLGSSACVLARR
jgi:hypothetical protein